MMLYILVPAVLCFILLLWLILEYSILIPAPKGIPILMYHKVSDNACDGITIPAAKLQKQLEYIRKKGYQTISFNELASASVTGKLLPPKPLILTFDDAYSDFMVRAVPLLRSFSFKASVFVPVGFIGQTNAWDKGSDAILTADEIRELARQGDVEFGLHSFLHQGYTGLNPAGIQHDLERCIGTLDQLNIPFIRVLAYPYGSYPGKDPHLNTQMKEIFRNAGLHFALRIGNRINPWPVRDPYELKRIDIRGTDDFYTFRTKLKKGRRKVFS
jgi:peptidoglycan/xylan/chitin deacetylase (PgdA/CDA1 family)